MNAHQTASQLLKTANALAANEGLAHGFVRNASDNGDVYVRVTCVNLVYVYEIGGLFFDNGSRFAAQAVIVDRFTQAARVLAQALTVSEGVYVF